MSSGESTSSPPPERPATPPPPGGAPSGDPTRPAAAPSGAGDPTHAAPAPPGGAASSADPTRAGVTPDAGRAADGSSAAPVSAPGAEPPPAASAGTGSTPRRSATPPPEDPTVTDPATGVPYAGGSDWPAQAADAVVEVVDKVRNATTGPVLTVARGVVYGLAIAVLGVTALVLLTIAAVRFVDSYLPGDVWSAYLLLGVLFTGAGLVLWGRRRAEPS